MKCFATVGASKLPRYVCAVYAFFPIYSLASHLYFSIAFVLSWIICCYQNGSIASTITSLPKASLSTSTNVIAKAVAHALASTLLAILSCYTRVPPPL